MLGLSRPPRAFWRILPVMLLVEVTVLHLIDRSTAGVVQCQALGCMPQGAQP